MKLQISYCSPILLLLCIIITPSKFQEVGVPSVEEVEVESTTPRFVFNDGDIEDKSIYEGNFDIKEEGDVVLITKQNFKHLIHTRKFVLVEFYAPWCGHCKSLEPEYSEAAGELKQDDLTLGKVDATVETDLAREYGIQGFPTLILFENGLKVEEYNGERSADGIVSYMRARSDPNWKPPPTNVIELTNDTWTEFMSKRELVLVMFYADYCQHCQKLKPEFASAAKVLKDYGVPLVQIEGTKNKDIADEFKVRGWPTLFVFRYGRAFEYKGTRESKGMISYMKEQLQPPSYECKKAKEVENRIERFIPTIIGVFSSSKSPFYDEFFLVANFLRGEPLRFIHTFNSKVGESLGISKGKEAVIVKKPTVFLSEYEPKEAKLTDSTKNGDEIAEFIRQNYRPFVGQRTKQNQVYFYSTRPIVVIYYDANFDYQFQKDSELIRKKVLGVAKDFPKITFAVANEEEFADELDAVNLDSGTDVNVIWFDKNRVKYRMEPSDDFDDKDLRTFIQQVQDGKLKPVWKSQPIPTRQEGPVRMIVANNYEEEIFQRNAMDSILYIYAPWCGHCKEFDKVYKKLAKNLSSSRLLFGKMDGTSNDLPPGLEVKGYPTIFFLKAKEKHEPKLYDGDRSYKHVRKFINQHSTKFKDGGEKEESEDTGTETPQKNQNHEKDEL